VTSALPAHRDTTPSINRSRVSVPLGRFNEQCSLGLKQNTGFRGCAGSHSRSQTGCDLPSRACEMIGSAEFAKISLRISSPTWLSKRGYHQLSPQTRREFPLQDRVFVWFPCPGPLWLSRSPMRFQQQWRPVRQPVRETQPHLLQKLVPSGLTRLRPQPPHFVRPMADRNQTSSLPP
jgi:hypothetical protein